MDTKLKYTIHLIFVLVIRLGVVTSNMLLHDFPRQTSTTLRNNNIFVTNLFK